MSTDLFFFLVCRYDNVCAHLSLEVCNLAKLLILSFELQLSVYSKEIMNFLKKALKHRNFMLQF